MVVVHDGLLDQRVTAIKVRPNDGGRRGVFVQLVQPTRATTPRRFGRQHSGYLIGAGSAELCLSVAAPAPPMLARTLDSAAEHFALRPDMAVRHGVIARHYDGVANAAYLCHQLANVRTGGEKYLCDPTAVGGMNTLNFDATRRPVGTGVLDARTELAPEILAPSHPVPDPTRQTRCLSGT